MSSDESTQAPLPSLRRSFELLDLPILPKQRRASFRRLGWRTALQILAALVVASAIGLALWHLDVWRLALWRLPQRRAQADDPGVRMARPPAAIVSAAAPQLPSTPLPNLQVNSLYAAGGSSANLAPDSRLDLKVAPRTHSLAFGSSKSFHEALLGAGLSAAEAEDVERALGRLLDFRKCRPEDRLTISRRPGGGLQSLRYQNTATEYFEATLRGGGDWQGKRVQVPVEMVPVARGGKVQTSIGEALSDAGLNGSLVGTFVQLFAGRADFHADTQPGDAFRVIIDEKRIQGRFLEYAPPTALEYIGKDVGTLRAIRYQTPDTRCRYFDEYGRALEGHWMRMPLRYDHISSRFNLRRKHPILRRIVPHYGVDFAAAKGTLVWAAAEGKVVFAGRSGPNGNLVTLRHAGGYETMYAHLWRIQSGIRAGKVVRQQQILGSVGSTGRSTGPHLHFAVKRHGAFVDPLRELRGPGRTMSAKHLPAYKAHARGVLSQLQQIPLAAPVTAQKTVGHGS